jgi:Ca2+-binding RTX toxin-like protein
MGRRGIIVAWGDSDAGGPFTYRARFLTRDALLVGDEFTVAAPSSAGNLTSTFALSSYANGIGSTIAFAYPRVTQNPNGEDIVAGVYARRYGFDPESPTRGSEFRVGSGPALLDLDVNVDPSGHFAVAWVETTRVHLHTRLYNADAVALTRDERFRFDTIGSPDLSEIVVAATATGGFLVKFQADIRSGNPSLTRMQEFAGPADARPSCMRFIAQTIGTNGADVIHGGGFNEAADDDVIHGLGGNDWINAHSGFDVVCGGGGADVIYGAADADLLSGGSGDDVVDGGTGWDVCHGDGHVNADTAVQCETIVTVP